MRHFIHLVFLLIAVAAIQSAGCASKVSSDAAFLLEEEYSRMTDAELIVYEQRLSDELVRTNTTAPGRDVGIGIGLGSWGSNVGVSLHADKWFGSGNENDTVRDLSLRRAEVRDEMRRRGLIPE